MPPRRKLIENDAVVFLDVSHFVFQRFYALVRWCKISGHEFASTEEMCDMFEKRFIGALNEFKKKLGFKWENFYMAMDCPRDTIWRMKLFPEYKSNRGDKTQHDFDPIVFVNTRQKIVPDLIAQHGVHVLEYPAAEADDVVAVCHASIRKSNPERDIIILTNDNDYLQLLDSKTRILNSNLVELKERFDQETLSVFGVWKSIRGDASDNIPAIDKKIGDKTALKYAVDETLLAEKLQNSDVKRTFELNKTLIMFEHIPCELRSGIECMFNKAYK
jgi:5'-3' exonuclease